jgi:predicted house-cleaning noncanonical NTP pyrophosphatase (MazG superfamily)
MHGFKKNEQLPANETTKRILIEDDKEEYIRNKNREYHSQLLDLISAMVNCEGFKYNHNEVWNMKIYAFMNSVKRISKIRNSQLLLQSGYSGYGINLKNINDKEIDWLGRLE